MLALIIGRHYNNRSRGRAFRSRVLQLLGRRLFAALVVLLVFGTLAARAAELSESDARLYGAAFAAARSGNWSRAWQDADNARNALLQPALRWIQLAGGGDAGFSEYAAFLASHPDWPKQNVLRQHAETQLSGISDAVAAHWFADHPPVTPAGRLRQAAIWFAEGRSTEATALIRRVWIESDFSSFEEKSMLQRFHGVLRPADHVERLDNLLWDGQIEAARRQMARVAPEYRELAAARLALAALEPGVERLVARLPAALQRDPSLTYDRVRWRRRKEHYDDAIALLESLPVEQDHAAAWATERQVLARYALAEAKPAFAYRIAARHGLTSGANFSELEFLAGWTALRFLHQPQIAYNHFVRLYDAAVLPISIGRGAYWAGRAAEAMGYGQLAETWFGTAAERVTTYYGQLAAARLGQGISTATLAEPQPRPDETAAFNGRQLVRVARGLAEIGATDFLPAFLRRLAETAVTPADYELVARFADQLGRPDLSVAAAKQASYNGVTLLAEGYPVISLPPGGEVERPLVLAMTRQESAFDEAAVSSAGARGLMQLMPATASTIARSLRLSFSLSRLTSDRHYNLTLGRAYLGGLLGDFSGSYVLAVAGYNAGPARVRQWIDSFGDPRRKGVDVVDWIESIPLAETRNYVQRVLENLQLYRLRLGDRDLAFSLASDLKR